MNSCEEDAMNNIFHSGRKDKTVYYGTICHRYEINMKQATEMQLPDTPVKITSINVISQKYTSKSSLIQILTYPIRNIP